MTGFAPNPINAPGAGQLALAVVLAVIGFALLLPRPRGRRAAIGSFLSLASLAVTGAWIFRTFGQPNTDQVGSIVFWFFSIGATVFAAALACQSNPARGAIAFAFVIISVCGLFLTLAAPFLMAATIVVYAGAIIVTFLFVLMLSHGEGPSDENDRSREPEMAAIAGFAFVGLVLFGLQEATRLEKGLPTPALSYEDRSELKDAIAQLDTVRGTTAVEIAKATDAIRSRVESTLIKIERRYRFLETPYPPPFAETQARVDQVRASQRRVENAAIEPGVDPVQRLADLRDQLRLTLGAAELPARNVGTIGLALYSEYLLAVEMAGTLLLVATIGAVAIAQKKGAVA